MRVDHMKVSTTEYEFAHGKKPRGEGRWGFQLRWDDGTNSPDTYWVYGKYSEASRKAKAWARALVGRFGSLVVCS